MHATVLDPAPTLSGDPPPLHRQRRSAAVAALAIGPALMWLSGWIHPHDSVSGLVTYNSAHGHLNLWLFAHLLGVAASLLWAWGATSLLRYRAGPGTRTIRVARRLLIVGTIAQAFDQWGHGIATYVAATTPNGAAFAPALIWHYEHAAPVNALMAASAALIVALPVLAVGLYRARVVPRPVTAALGLSIVPPMFVNNSGWPLFAAAVPMMAAFVYLAASMLRRDASA